MVSKPRSQRMTTVISVITLIGMLLPFVNVFAQTPDKAIYCYYSHTSGPAENITAGMTVKKGDLIGYSGNTGYGSGWTPENPVTVPHLHFACTTLTPDEQEAETLSKSGAWSWIDPNPALYGWVSPLANLYESGAAYYAFNGAGGQSHHNGRDYRASMKTPLYAVADGTIEYVGWWPKSYEKYKTGHGAVIVLKIGGVQNARPQQKLPEKEETYTPRAAQGDPIQDWQQPLAPMWKYSPTVWWWRRDIYAWAKAWNVNPNAVATIMQIESCGLPTAKSGSNALGLFQVVPKWHLVAGETEDQLYDPQFNADKGLLYYTKTCLVAAKGDPYRAAACYNGGASVLNTAEQYWPSETKSYVKWFQMLEDAYAGSDASSELTTHVTGGSRPGGLCAKAADWQMAHPRTDSGSSSLDATQSQAGEIVASSIPGVEYDGKTIYINWPPFGFVVFFMVLSLIIHYAVDRGRYHVRFKDGFQYRRPYRYGKGFAKAVLIVVLIFYFPLNFGKIFTAMDEGIMPYNNLGFVLRRDVEEKTKFIDTLNDLIVTGESKLPEYWAEKIEVVTQPIKTMESVRTFFIDIYAWLGDDPVLTPLFRFVSNQTQLYLVPKAVQAGSDWVSAKKDFASTIIPQGQVAVVRKVSDSAGHTNPWGIHGRLDYRKSNVRSWLGTDLILPEDTYVQAPFAGTIEAIISSSDGEVPGVSVWLTSADIRLGLINLNKEDTAKLKVGQAFDAGTPIARPGGPHLHVVLEVRNKDGGWADYPLTLLLSSTGTPIQWYESTPPYYDPFVPTAEYLAAPSDYLIKEAKSTP